MRFHALLFCFLLNSASALTPEPVKEYYVTLRKGIFKDYLKEISIPDIVKTLLSQEFGVEIKKRHQI